MVAMETHSAGDDWISPKAASEALQSLLNVIPEDLALDPKASSSQLRKLRKQIEVVLERLGTLLQEADPVKLPTYIFDPADAHVERRGA